MKIQIKEEHAKILSVLKYQAFTHKASCDALIDVPKKQEKRLEELEDFFEEVYETLYDYTPKTSTQFMVRKGTFAEDLSQLEQGFESIMSSLDTLVKDARKSDNLPAELLYIGLYEQGVFPPKKED